MYLTRIWKKFSHQRLMSLSSSSSLLFVRFSVRSKRTAKSYAVHFNDLWDDNCRCCCQNCQQPSNHNSYENHFWSRLKLFQRVHDALVAVSSEGNNCENRNANRDFLGKFTSAAQNLTQLAFPRPVLGNIDEPI